MTESKKLTPTVFLWLDTETLGLDPEKAPVIELAAFITDESFTKISAEPFHRVVPCTVGEWSDAPLPVVSMHTENGLHGAVFDERRRLAGEQAWTTEEARRYRVHVDSELADWIRSNTPDGMAVTLAGSSPRFDSAMLRAQYPVSFGLLHYRLLDVTSLMFLFQAALGENPPRFGHGAAHRAMDDIQDSWQCAVTYRDRLSILPPY